MSRRLLALALLTLSGCGASCGQGATAPSLLCDYPGQVGPDGTDGECDLGSICLPAAIAPCAGNNCCHLFCSIEGCPNGTPCLQLTPDQLPDGGPVGCGCGDGGACACADGGPCLRTSCLSVCSQAS